MGCYPRPVHLQTNRFEFPSPAELLHDECKGWHWSAAMNTDFTRKAISAGSRPGARGNGSQSGSPQGCASRPQVKPIRFGKPNSVARLLLVVRLGVKNVGVRKLIGGAFSHTGFGRQASAENALFTHMPLITRNPLAIFAGRTS